MQHMDQSSKFHMCPHKKRTHQCMHPWDRCNHLVWGLAQGLAPSTFHRNSCNKLCTLCQEQLGTAQCMHRVIHLDTEKGKALAQAMVLDSALARELVQVELEAKVLGTNIAGNHFHCRLDKMCPRLGLWPNTVRKR